MAGASEALERGCWARMASGPGSVPAVGGGCGKGESPGPGTPCFYLRSQQPYPPPPLPSRCSSHGRELRECSGVCGLGGFGPKAALAEGRGWGLAEGSCFKEKVGVPGCWDVLGCGFWVHPTHPMLSALPHWFPLPFHLPIPLNVFLLALCVPLCPWLSFPCLWAPSSLILLLWVLVMFSPQLTHLSLSSASLIHSA